MVFGLPLFLVATINVDQIVKDSYGTGMYVGFASAKGITVLTGGHSNVEKGLAAQPTDLISIASLSKPVTAIVLANALTKSGKDLTIKPMLEVPALAQLTKDQFKDISLADLFLHRHNLPRDFKSQGFEGNDPAKLRLERVAALLQDNERPNPERKSQYSNAGYVLLTAAVEQLTGRTYEEMLDTSLHKGMGLASFGMGRPPEDKVSTVPYVWSKDAFKTFGHNRRRMLTWQPSGGYYCTMSDLIALGREYNRGVLGQQSSISNAAIQMLQEKGAGRCMGWSMTSQRDLMMLTHGGAINGETCEMVLVPSRNWVLAYYKNFQFNVDWEETNPFEKNAVMRGKEAMWDLAFLEAGIRTPAASDISFLEATSMDKDFKLPAKPSASDESVNVNVKFRVQGGPINDFKLRCSIGNQVAYVHWLNGLKPGTHNFNIRIPNPGKGNHSVVIELDPLSMVNDVNRANNRFQTTVEIQ